MNTVISSAFADRLASFSAGWTPLPDKPDETAEYTLRALWCTAAGQPRPLLDRQALEPLTPEQHAKLDSLIQRRLAGAPLAHLVGRQIFMGLELLASEQALIPRVETELLCRTAMQCLEESAAAAPLVIDICTGSGNIAVAIAAHVLAARVFAADLSPDAVGLARANARHLGVQDRITFGVGDLFAPFDNDPALRASVNLVSCNPPYISSAKVDRLPTEIGQHEPRLAFDGGPLGLDILSRAVAGAPRFLSGGGWFCCEVGAGQGRFIADRIRRNGAFDIVRELPDANGVTRVVSARKKCDDAG